MKHTSQLPTFFIFPTAVFLAHLTASKILHLYAIFPNMDIPFHFLGGFSVAYTSAKVLSYLQNENTIARLNRVIFILLLISLTATAAVFWEFMEFTGDQIFHTNVQISLANTMQDQFMGILGGTTMAIVHWKKNILLEG